MDVVFAQPRYTSDTKKKFLYYLLNQIKLLINPRTIKIFKHNYGFKCGFICYSSRWVFVRWYQLYRLLKCFLFLLQCQNCRLYLVFFFFLLFIVLFGTQDVDIVKCLLSFIEILWRFIMGLYCQIFFFFNNLSIWI